MSFACIVQLFHHFISLKWRHPGVWRADDCGKSPKASKWSLQIQPGKEKPAILHYVHFTLNTAVVAAKGCARRAVRHLNVMLLQAGGHVLQEGLIMSEDVAEHC